MNYTQLNKRCCKLYIHLGDVGDVVAQVALEGVGEVILL